MMFIFIGDWKDQNDELLSYCEPALTDLIFLV